MKKMITDNLICKYKAYLTEEEKSAATVEKYIRDIKAFAVWVKNREVDKAAVLGYKEHLKELYAPSSVNSMLSSLNSFFVYNEWYGLKVKFLRIQKQIFASGDKELSKDEYNQLLQAAKKCGNMRLYYLMQTVCATGIRISELRFITCESIAHRRAVINLKGKTRIVMIPDKLCRILSGYAKKQEIRSGCIFRTKSGKPLDRSNIWSDMKRLCGIAGVSKEKVFPHNFRHLFARTFYSVRKDIVRLADILGHSSVNTTRIYTAETGEIHRRQIQKLGLLI